MRLAATLALLLALLLSGAGPEGCADDAPGDGNVQSGECEAGEIWCVDTGTIQYCPQGTWTDPEECPPETTGSEVPVVIPTSCGEFGCQPG